MSVTLPNRLQAIVDEFADLPPELRLEALLDYSRRVPPLPPRLAGHREEMERVPECQTPFFLATEVGDGEVVTIHFDAPPEAPTTRGFAGIISEGLNHAPADEVLAVPDGFYTELGLDRVISPLRLRGIAAILARLKRQVRVQVDAHARGAGQQARG
jgi:cysteine desulfuration protein SufE